MKGLLFVTTFLAVAFVSKAQTTKSSLAKELMEDYDKNAPHEGSRKLTLNLNLLQIFHCAKTQHFLVKGNLHLVWQDDRLTWNKAEKGIDKLWIPYDDINLPDINLINGGSKLELDMSCLFNQAVVYSNGTVVWTPRVSFFTICDFNYDDYPWGEQSCSIQFGSQTRDIEAGSPGVGANIENLQTSWYDVLSNTVKEMERPMACCPEEKQNVLEYNMVFYHKTYFCQKESRLKRYRKRGCNQDRVDYYYDFEKNDVQ